MKTLRLLLVASFLVIHWGYPHQLYGQALSADFSSITQLTNNSPDRFLLLVNGMTGLEENQAEDDGIEIYSYGDQVFIKTDDPGVYQVGLYNLLGQQLLYRNFSVREVSGLTGLQSGFYLVTVKTENAYKTKKVFIK